MDYKVIFHIDELNKWNLTLKNVNNLLEAIDGDNFNIEVLANAEAELNTRRIMKNLSDRGIKFIACNNALKAFEIKQEDLINFVHIVPVGVLELVRKQMEGYGYIKP